MAKQDKVLQILAGPNGSGKSTLATILNHSRTKRFINADIIAKGIDLSSKNGAEIEAGKIMLTALNDALTQNDSFSFETTLSGRIWIKYINEAKKRGFIVSLIFVTVDDVDTCIERVKERVKNGGHDIPSETIKRRFHRSHSLFKEVYSKMSDEWYIFDNTETKARLVACKSSKLKDEEIFLDDIMKRFIVK